jgi:predicted esterase
MTEYHPQKVVVIGFSQGGATAARWIANGNITADAFVSWASVFPPDLPFPTETIAAKAAKLHFVLGTTDPYFDSAAAEKACEAHMQLGFGVVRFEGGHDLDPIIVQQLIEQL